MSEHKKDGGPAFPGIEVAVVGISSDGEERTESQAHGGMSLRDYFAAKSLNAILSQDGPGIESNHPGGVVNVDGMTAAQQWAKDAYLIADAMLAERAK